MSFKMAKELLLEYESQEMTRLTRQYLALLDYPQAAVRVQGINGLKKTGTWSEYVTQFADDSDFRVRKALAEYIKENGTQNHQPVIERLLADPDDRVRLSALAALYAINPEPEALKQYLKDPSPKIRARLLKIASAELSMDDIQPLLSDKDNGVCTEAYLVYVEKTEDAEILEKIVKETRFPQVRKSALQKLLVYHPAFVVSFYPEMLGSSLYSEKEKKILLSILKFLPFDAIQGVLHQVFEDPQLRMYYPTLIPLYVDINLESPATVISLLSKWVDDEEASVRLAAVKGFGKLSEPATVSILRDKLGDFDEKVRSAAVEALSRLLDYELENVIEELVKDHSYLVRKSALKAISKLKLEDEYAYLTEKIAEKKEELRVRKTGIEQSAKVRYSYAIELLKTIMKDESENSDIRSSAAQALLRISPAAVIELLGG
jgi:HEAT repeat protein